MAEATLMKPSHPHPCRFRLIGWRDRGWGEAAFCYAWDSTSGVEGEAGSNPDLPNCRLYEYTTYDDNAGRYADGWFLPPDPPFVGWQFRNPTDGRTASVGAECFAATEGRAWDRHKLGGRLHIPRTGTAGQETPHTFTVKAIQQYRCHCALCGEEFALCAPHSITRTFARDTDGSNGKSNRDETELWRYALTKHTFAVWMDMNRAGYVADSADIGFGPVF